MCRRNKSNWDWIAKSFHITSLNSKSHKDKYKEIASLILALNPEKVLDLGCGTGILEKELLGAGYKGRIIGIDGSKEMLGLARKFSGESKVLCYRNKNLDQNFSTGECYDLIISINLFFFLLHKEKFLRNVNNSLRDKDSKFIMVTPYSQDKIRLRDYVNDHFEGMNLREIFLTIIGQLINLPHYSKMLLNEMSVRRQESAGTLGAATLPEIELMAAAAGLKVINNVETNDKKGIMIEMRRA